MQRNVVTDFWGLGHGHLGAGGGHSAYQRCVMLVGTKLGRVCV